MALAGHFYYLNWCWRSASTTNEKRGTVGAAPLPIGRGIEPTVGRQSQKPTFNLGSPIPAPTVPMDAPYGRSTALGGRQGARFRESVTEHSYNKRETVLQIQFGREESMKFYQLGLILTTLALSGCGAFSATTLRCGTDADASYVEVASAPQALSSNVRALAELCGFAYEREVGPTE